MNTTPVPSDPGDRAARDYPALLAANRRETAGYAARHFRRDVDGRKVAVQTGNLKRPATIEEPIAIEETLTPTLLMYVTVAEEIGIEPSEALQMLYTGVVSEGVEIAGGLLDIDGALTTWAMNTRTGAVSEYSNFEFNSFARIGNKYIGASTSGVYELLGDAPPARSGEI